MFHEADDAQPINQNNSEILNKRNEPEQPSSPSPPLPVTTIDKPITDMNNNNQSKVNQDFFEMTPDMEQAMRELELRQREDARMNDMMDSDDLYDLDLYNDEMLPEYDVREKLESLNAQLANEPDPPEPEKRKSRVVFREELISLEVPPPEIIGDEESVNDEDDDHNDQHHHPIEDDPIKNHDQEITDQEEKNQKPIETVDNDNDTKELLPTNNFNDNFTASNKNDYDDDGSKKEQQKSVTNPKYDPELSNKEINSKEPDDLNETTESEPTLKPNNDEQPQSTASDLTETGDQSIENDDKMIEQNDFLIKRNGDFHMVNESHMISSQVYNESQTSKNSSNRSVRPTSAPAFKNRGSNNRRQVGSAYNAGSSSNSSNNSNRSDKTNSSKNEIPRVDRLALQKQQERKARQEEKRQKEEEEELRKKHEEMAKAFDSWLKGKIEQEKEERQRRREQEEKDKKNHEELTDQRKKEHETTEEKLKKQKEEQRKREEKMNQYRQKELEEGPIHTDAERRRAFKEWLKGKQREQKRKEREERHRARVTRLAMRQCRKSQNLAQAISNANSFRYMDFCGYP